MSPGTYTNEILMNMRMWSIYPQNKIDIYQISQTSISFNTYYLFCYGIKHRRNIFLDKWYWYLSYRNCYIQSYIISVIVTLIVIKSGAVIFPL